MIRIVNMRIYKGEGYRVDRESPVGNPFLIGDIKPYLYEYANLAQFLKTDPPNIRMNRADVIELYRKWLGAELRVKRAKVCDFMNMLYKHWTAHDELVLKCWCAPEDCHARIIKETLEEAKALIEWRK